MVWLPGDQLIAFNVSASFAHLRGGTLIEYISLPSFPNMDLGAFDPAAPGGLANNANAIGFHDGLFWYSGEYLDLSGDVVTVVLTVNPADDSVVVVLDQVIDPPFGEIGQLSWAAPDRTIMGRISVANVRYWDGAISGAGSTLPLAQVGAGEMGMVRPTDSVLTPPVEYTYGIDGDATQVVRHDLSNDVDLGTIFTDPDGQGCLGLDMKPDASEMLLGLASGAVGAACARRVSYDGSTILQSYATAGLPLAHSVRYETDLAHFWVGQAGAPGLSEGNLFRFTTATGLYQSYTITREEGNGGPGLFSVIAGAAPYLVAPSAVRRSWAHVVS